MQLSVTFHFAALCGRVRSLSQRPDIVFGVGGQSPGDTMTVLQRLTPARLRARERLARAGRLNSHGTHQGLWPGEAQA
jgi:hypothetical protein